jgi:thiol:disulfide interchange protein DsbC
MRNYFRIAAVCFAAVTLNFAAYADQTADDIRSALQARMPDIEIKSIAKAPIAGLYEVNLGSRIIYSDSNGDYVIVGDLVDTKTRANLSEARMAELNKVDFARLPLVDAVKVVKGNGSRKMVVFSDPDCPYCRQLETTISSIDDVTVYTFLYPVLSPDSLAKSRAIWCAPDRARTWEAWMQDHRVPEPAPVICDTSAIDNNLALGREMGVRGTPTIILANGRRLPGAVSADALERALRDLH